MARLVGKVAVVTGAGGGIGRASALRFAIEQASVVCVDIDEDAASATADAITSSGGAAFGVRVDVSEPEQVARLAERVAEQFQTVDVVYANAGIAGTGTALSTDVDRWRRVIDVNLTGAWLTAKYLLPPMLAAGSGSIIMQASIGGLVGMPDLLPYAAAKAGVIGITRQMAADFGPSGVRVNSICPGTVPTALVAATQGSDAGLERLAARHPMRRLGTVDDIANMAVFLASDESSWVTGGVFVVDGGYTAI